MEEASETADDTADDTVAQLFACWFDTLTVSETGDLGEKVSKGWVRVGGGGGLFVDSKLMREILCFCAPWFHPCTTGEVRLT